MVRCVAAGCSTTPSDRVSLSFPAMVFQDVNGKSKFSGSELSGRLPSTLTFVVTTLLRTALRSIRHSLLSWESKRG